MPKVNADLPKEKDVKGKKSVPRSKRKVHEISDLSDSDDLFDGIVLSEVSADDDGADGDDSSVSGDDDDAKKKKKTAKLDSGHSSDVRSLFSVVDSEVLLALLVSFCLPKFVCMVSFLPNCGRSVGMIEFG